VLDCLIIRDAMFLLALSRLLGIEPLADGSMLLNVSRAGVDGIEMDYPLFSGTFPKRRARE